MDRNSLNAFTEWFFSYCESFSLSDPEDLKNMSLKVKHTSHVRENIVSIAEEQRVDQSMIFLVETAALFHDLGRFPQYAQYRTFRDSISVNHGRLGAEILEKENVLKSLTDREADVIITSVKFHNAYAVPDFEDGEKIFVLKLLRDADKLDIWRVFAEYYEGSEAERASAVNLGLPDTPEYSENVLTMLSRERMVSLAAVKSVNDFKLMQLSWIYDLNFTASFRLLLERDLINRIAAALPRKNDIREVLVLLKEYVYRRMKIIAV